MEVIRIHHPTGVIQGSIKLDGSKSISNRVLMIRALCSKEFQIKNLSNSDDTRVLDKLLKVTDQKVYDVGHAGTSFRFLTAYLATQRGKQELTGSARMKKRPIGPLVDALHQIGCRIEYMDRSGYPPLKIKKPNELGVPKKIEIRADMSSQYLSALILIAPTLPDGLEIHLKGDIVSESYLRMTLRLIDHYGIEYIRRSNKITIPSQKYKSKNYKVESDWSASSYYYSITALAADAEIKLKGLHENSIQGDSAMMGIGRMLCIDSAFDDDHLRITKGRHQVATFDYDFINQPDLAQTIAVICAANGVNATFSGLQTLRIKETDRIAALDTELSKIGGGFKRVESSKDEELYQVTGPIEWDESSTVPRFATYKDHRMAMAFAPLALIAPIEIENPGVVSKSYPDFWTDLESLGFVIEPVSL